MELELEQILNRLDNVIRTIGVDGAVQHYSENDLRRSQHHFHSQGDTRTCLAELREHLTAIRAWYLKADLALQSERPFDVVAQNNATTPQIAFLVRGGLLTQWLCSTEFGMRLHAYTVTDAFKNAVISDLIDVPANRPHRPEIEAELSGITRIDLDVIDEWAAEAGMLSATAPQPTPGEARSVYRGARDISPLPGIPAGRRDAASRPRQGRCRGGTSPRRRALGKISDRSQVIESTPISVTVPRAAFRGRRVQGRASASVPARPQSSPALPPTISVSFSQASTTTRTGSFGILSSSVGGQTMTVSETTGDTGQVGAGISVSTTTALDVGVDASYVDRDGTEIGIAIRSPGHPRLKRLGKDEPGRRQRGIRQEIGEQD
ncbi:hypothetical protein [Cupriavidus sp. H18C1]|uniref:hypothetical protein n=1 Tax=Cupriavidus sp. H18C1 TaxID=3241601 RepID=UPI003BB8AA18